MQLRNYSAAAPFSAVAMVARQSFKTAQSDLTREQAIVTAAADIVMVEPSSKVAQ
jgi:hypothetical protein